MQQQDQIAILTMMNVRKLVQALAYFASKTSSEKIDAWKAYKLLWLSDRYHLRQYGRMITGDTYYALPHGPVPSDAKHVIDGMPLSHLADVPGYAEKYVHSIPEKRKYQVVAPVDTRVFSQTDIKAMDKVYEIYGHWTCKQLEALSHQYPDWNSYQDLIAREGEKDAHPIDVNLFFQNPENEQSPLFKDDSPELLELTRELYFQYHRA